MKSYIRIFSIICLLTIGKFLSGQGQANTWLFGNLAGLNFNNTPPTPIVGSAMTTAYASACMSDPNGNLLFYTNGINIWNSSHAIMANGSGLATNSNGPQNCIILKQPGSTNLYYVVYVQWANCFNCISNLYYATVDMSLAAGQGSVTAKNVVIASANTNSLTIGSKITATRHCNGSDIWILTKESFWNNTVTSGTYTPNFRAYLLTSAGINTTAVISPAATFSAWANTNSDWWGNIKFSPNGKKIGCANYNNGNINNSLSNTAFEIYDFDNTTGVVTNSMALPVNTTNVTWNGGMACEFSPDGTKFYGVRYFGNSLQGTDLYQWNLCAGTPSAIAASLYTVASAATNWATSLQVAKNGKIYFPKWNQSTIDVINNPNGLGAACGFIASNQTLGTSTSWYGLPNFMTSYFLQHPPATPFTHTVGNQYGCQGVQFNSTYNPTITSVGCASSGYSLTGLQWNFGDPASGLNNTSGLVSPTHNFTNLGTYTVELVLYYSCGGGTDTLKQVVNVNQPCISVTSSSITCASLGSATVVATGGTGPFSYTWTPSGQTSSVAVGLTPGTYTLTVFDFGNNFTYTATTLFTSLIPLTGNLNVSSSITCHGASTGTANVTNLNGGSNNSTNVNYNWFNGAVSLTTPTVSTLSAGVWTLTVTDNTTGCQINEIFFISQPPAMVLNLSSNSPTTCAGSTVNLSGVNSGGTPYPSGPAYTYSWVGGPGTDTYVATRPAAGIHTYTLVSRDFHNCPISNTIPISYISNPVLSVSNTSICPLETGILNVSGASSYTWSNNSTGNFLALSPLTTTQYSVTGSAFGCTSSTSAYIILKPVPFPILNSNSPVCDGKNLNLAGFGGLSYQWEGPLGFTATGSSPVISNANPNQSGVYSFTATAVNGCTAAISKTLTVNPIPTITAIGSTVCVLQVINLSANSFAGASYTWTGPGFNSNLQNPSINSATLNHSGNYSVKVFAASGCTNSAIAHVTVTAMPQPVFISNSPQCFGSTLSFTASGGDTYSWSGPNSFNSNLQNPFINNITVPASGVYNLQVTRGPCVNTISNPVIINPLPAFTTNNNSPVCETKSLSLSASLIANATYQWKGPLGFLKHVRETGLDSCKLINSGIYTITIVDANSCKNTQIDTIIVAANPTLVPVSATVCLNQSASLMISGAQTYSWTGPAGYQSYSDVAFIPNANSSVISIYTVTGKAANTCTSITKASLTTLSLPLPSLQVLPKAKVCFNEQISLHGFGGDYYQWKGPSRNHPERILTFTVNTPFHAGTYTLIVTDKKGCSSYTTTTIDVDPLPNGSLEGTFMDACVPFSSDFKYYSTASSATNVTVSWQLKDTLIKSKNFSRNFKVAEDYIINGLFKDTVTGCVNAASFTVNARPIPKADFVFTPEKPVEGLQDVVFTNTSTGTELTKWNWSFINNLGYQSQNKNASYFFEQAGNYPVALVVKNVWGCADTVVKEIKVEPDFNVYVPNIFTPNGDGKNDVFMPVASGIKFYELQIFNRWGAKLFQTSDLQNGWDGVFNGQLCKSEVYIWRIKVSAKNGEIKDLNGHVTLYR